MHELVDGYNVIHRTPELAPASGRACRPGVRPSAACWRQPPARWGGSAVAPKGGSDVGVLPDPESVFDRLLFSFLRLHLTLQSLFRRR